ESYPFDRVVDDLAVPRDAGRSPLFDVMLSVAPEAPSAFELDGVPVRAADVRPDVSQFDVTLNIAASPGGGFDGSLAYRTDLFARPRIARMAAHFAALLDRVSVDPAALVRRISSLPEEERRDVLTTFNDTGAAFDEQATLVSVFESQAARTP